MSGIQKTGRIVVSQSFDQPSMLLVSIALYIRNRNANNWSQPLFIQVSKQQIEAVYCFQTYTWNTT